MLRTIVIENPGHLFVKNSQLMIRKEYQEHHIGSFEDIGWILLEHPQLTLTQSVLAQAAEQNTVIIFCGDHFYPVSLAIPTDGNYVQGERIRWQFESSVPRRKSLWKQLIQLKILNQGLLLELLNKDSESIIYLRNKVKSGDPENTEAVAARRYWPRLMGENFRRDRIGMVPNPWLNYGYAILRSCATRMLTATGLHPGYGVHHANKYNPYALADDIMEPFRPWVDRIAWSMYFEHDYGFDDLNTSMKKELIEVLQHDVKQGNMIRPLAGAVQMLAYEVGQYLGDKIQKLTPVEIISLDIDKDTWNGLPLD